MATQQKMSAGEAQSFGRFSHANATRAEEGLSCGCLAYRDIFTYRRWQAQGFQVQRGQKAVRLPIVREVTEEGEDGEAKTRRVLGGASVFCRHQVEAVNGTKQEAPAPVQKEPEPQVTTPIVQSRIDALMGTWKAV